MDITVIERNNHVSIKNNYDICNSIVAVAKVAEKESSKREQ